MIVSRVFFPIAVPSLKVLTLAFSWFYKNMSKEKTLPNLWSRGNLLTETSSVQLCRQATRVTSKSEHIEAVEEMTWLPTSWQWLRGTVTLLPLLCALAEPYNNSTSRSPLHLYACYFCFLVGHFPPCPAAFLDSPNVTSSQKSPRVSLGSCSPLEHWVEIVFVDMLLPLWTCWGQMPLHPQPPALVTEIAGNPQRNEWMNEKLPLSSHLDDMLWKMLGKPPHICPHFPSGHL